MLKHPDLAVRHQVSRRVSRVRRSMDIRLDRHSLLRCSLALGERRVGRRSLLHRAKIRALYSRSLTRSSSSRCRRMGTNSEGSVVWFALFIFSVFGRCLVSLSSVLQVTHG